MGTVDNASWETLQDGRARALSAKQMRKDPGLVCNKEVFELKTEKGGRAGHNAMIHLGLRK